MSEQFDKYKSDEKLDNCIDELKRLYEVDPKRAIKEVERFNANLKSIVFSKQPSEVEKRNNIIVLVVLSIIILLEGLFILTGSGKVASIGLYFAGFLFFISGHFVGMNDKGYGLIFLFSHSVTGMCLMISSMLGNIINNPILSDLPTNGYYYLLATIAMFVVATIYVIIFNLSERVKQIKYSRFIPLIIYIIGFAMAGLFDVVIMHI